MPLACLFRCFPVGPERAIRRIGIERTAQHSRKRRTVAVGVVNLGVERKPAPFEPFDNMQLPQGPVPVQQEGVQSARQLAELSAAARRGKRRAANVILEIEVRVPGPLGTAGRRDPDPSVEGSVGGSLQELFVQVGHEVPGIVFRGLVDLNACDVAWAVLGLGEEKRVVRQGNPAHKFLLGRSEYKECTTGVTCRPAS